ncbi:TerB family tellurite resistance protein [Tianweitania sp. BSSL-BM11]|uniref:TerB family tellurite resistance protein n=1 Tax=Tianweitania aestuarii TaxID=2814886 RepID=A0ABS5RWX0_9HYPH|nr:TerB family tellurite resistance protein [Tianweitania aestuarii]MBS9720797.1 TerB family tellurite resistance protein [Tianweitania aestuarii]
MPQGLINKLKSVFGAEDAVARVAEDPILTAELLLLFRMILADGEISDAELETLRRICQGSFGIDEADLDDVVDYLRTYGYETSVAQSLAIFRRLDHDRKQLLARHMAEIAKADHHLEKQEVQLLARALKLLEIEPSEIVNAPR